MYTAYGPEANHFPFCGRTRGRERAAGREGRKKKRRRGKEEDWERHWQKWTERREKRGERKTRAWAVTGLPGHVNLLHSGEADSAVFSGVPHLEIGILYISNAAISQSERKPPNTYTLTRPPFLPSTP